MPRPSKPENRNNPLRKLREHLGTNGQPMSQLKLSKLLGVSKETVFSIENGRLNNGNPTPRVLNLINERLGAVWSEEDKEWQLFPGTPLTQQNYKLWSNTKFDRVTEIDALCGALIYLLQHVPDERFAAASDAVFRKLSELAKQYGVSTTAREFLRSDLVAVALWRGGEQTKKSEDVVGFERQRDHIPSCGISALYGLPDRERLDYRFKLAELPLSKTPASPSPHIIKPSSGQRSKRAAADGSPKTSTPQPQ
jgi:transcriptional regulator with XRE-family HTH domain